MVKAKPRWFWSGVEELTQDNDETRLRLVVALLIPRKLKDEEILAHLADLRARLQGWLHQDEFGPNRGQQAAAIRTLMQSMNKLRKQLLVGNRELRARLDVDLCEGTDPPNTVIEAICEVAADIKHDLQIAGAPTHQITWASRLLECAERSMVLLQALDTNAEGETLLAATKIGFDWSQTAGDDFGLGKAERWLDSAGSVLFDTLGVLNSRSGAEEGVSLKLLVEQLCQLWERETQNPVTAHAIVKDVHTSRPVTPAGRFIVAAVEAMLPNESWFVSHPAESKRATVFLPSQRASREHQILGIMRDFVRRRGEVIEGRIAH